MISKILCRCGHTKGFHWNDKNKRCYFDGMDKSDLLLIGEYKEKGCRCEGFVIDNLKYLEWKYDQQHI